MWVDWTAIEMCAEAGGEQVKRAGLGDVGGAQMGRGEWLGGEWVESSTERCRRRKKWRVGYIRKKKG